MAAHLRIFPGDSRGLRPALQFLGVPEHRHAVWTSRRRCRPACRLPTPPPTRALWPTDLSARPPPRPPPSPSIRVSRSGTRRTWNITLQKDLPWGMQMQANYTGIKGTRLPQTFYPNSWAPGGPNPCPTCPVGFQYEASNGNSTRHAGQPPVAAQAPQWFPGASSHIRMRRRLTTSAVGSGAELAQSERWSEDYRVSISGRISRLLKSPCSTPPGWGSAEATFLSGWRAAVL